MFEARKKEGLSGTDKADNTNSGAFTHTHTGTNILHNKGDKALPYHFPMTKLN